MPRKAKAPKPGNQGGYQGHGDPGGGPAGQPPRAPTGMPYGEHQLSIQSQQQMPVAGAPQPVPGGAPQQGGMAQALMAAMQSAPPQAGGLTRPSERPNEPVTHGLPTGPGAGPEALQSATGSSLFQTFQAIADATGDPAMHALAERARILTGA